MKIYEGDEVVTELASRPYYGNVLARVKFFQDPVYDWDWKWQPVNMKRYPNVYFHADFSEEGRLHKIDQKKFIIIGDEYIVSVHNRFHSQLMMPKISIVHFNCTKRIMHEYWKHEQSPCWNRWNNSNGLIYDENGEVVKN